MFSVPLLGALALAACASPGGGRPMVERAVLHADVLEKEEYFVLGAGVPSDLHVRLHHKEDDSDVSEEAVVILEAGCSDGRCIAEITNDGAIRVQPSDEGHVDLTVRARASDGQVHTQTFDLEVAEMRLDVVFDPNVSRGAADGVAEGATVTWYSMLDDVHGTLRMPELEPSPSIDPSFEVTMGKAFVATKREAPRHLFDRPAAYLCEHTITFASPGHVRLLARFGAHRKEIDVDVVDTTKVTALDIRQRPKQDRMMPAAIDVAVSAGYFDEPPVSTLALQYPNGGATLVTTILDADGRRGVGGKAALSLDVGSVVWVTPYEEDPSGGTFFVTARTLGISTVRARFGEATTSFRAEVR